MKKHTLSAVKRDIVGRKVKSLRAKGEIPGTVYGKDVKSVSITVNKDAFTNVYSEAGESGLIELSIENENSSTRLPAGRQVLIHTVQKDPVRGAILHVEFYQVNLKQKVKTNVPLEFTGEAPAAVQKTGVLLTLIDEVEVEALPTDLPEKILVDISKLAQVDDEVRLGDIAMPTRVALITAPDQSIVRVGALISKEAEAQATAEAAEAAAKAAAAPTETAPTATTEAPSEAKPEATEEKK